LSDVITKSTVKLLVDSSTLSDVLLRTAVLFRSLVDSLSLSDVITKNTVKFLVDSSLLNDVINRVISKIISDIVNIGVVDSIYGYKLYPFYFSALADVNDNVVISGYSIVFSMVSVTYRKV
jgi:hypothetical protein